MTYTIADDYKPSFLVKVRSKNWIRRHFCEALAEVAGLIAHEDPAGATVSWDQETLRVQLKSGNGLTIRSRPTQTEP